MNDSIIFKIQQQTIEDTAGRGDDQSAPLCEKQYGVDDDQWIKYGINAPDAARDKDKTGNQ
jgi:hypothetical protein